jgi:hypothetical protein
MGAVAGATFTATLKIIGGVVLVVGGAALMVSLSGLPETRFRKIGAVFQPFMRRSWQVGYARLLAGILVAAFLLTGIGLVAAGAVELAGYKFGSN